MSKEHQLQFKHLHNNDGIQMPQKEEGHYCCSARVNPKPKKFHVVALLRILSLNKQGFPHINL